jgi:hypothetical protein
MNHIYRAIFSLLLLLIYSFNTYSQKVELISGNPQLFKEVKYYYLTFDYSDLQVGKYGSEQAYIDYMKDDAEKRKKGSSENWLNNWLADRTNLYQPKFIELFNNYIGNKNIKIYTNLTDQKYELNFHTKFIELGFNKNGKSAPALVNAIVTISDINNRENSLVISLTDIPGKEIFGSYSPNNRRIEEAYGKCGKELAQYMSRVIY